MLLPDQNFALTPILSYIWTPWRFSARTSDPPVLHWSGSILIVPAPSPAALASVEDDERHVRTLPVNQGVVWFLHFTLPVGWRRGEICVILPPGSSRWHCLDPRCVKFSLCSPSPSVVLVFHFSHRLHPLFLSSFLSFLLRAFSYNTFYWCPCSAPGPHFASSICLLCSGLQGFL